MGAAAVVMPGMAAQAFAANAKPNVVVIMTDEHNFRTLGCYRETLPPEQAYMWGKTVVETPNLDRLAKSGALCERFYASSPVCSPSRASFVTGLYPQNAGMMVNNLPLKDSCVTFAQVLKDNGYATGYAGKWHLEDGGMPGWTPKRKFGFDDNLYMYNRGHWKKLKDTPNGPEIATKSGNRYTMQVAGADETSFSTDFFTTKTIDFINKNKDKPFCYMLSIADPHGPDSVRAPYDKMYKNVKWEVARTYNMSSEGAPYWASAMKEASTTQDKYYGMIKCIDDNVGRVLDALEKNGLRENTIIVFTADHGDMRGEHHKENKGNPFEASAKVPFLISYPAKIKAGLRIKDTIGNVDFKPTLLALAGVPDNSKNDGRDLSKPFLGKKYKGKDITFTRCENWGAWTGAISGPYKLIIDRESIWLADLDKDPDEIKNFVYDPAYSAVVKEMALEFLNYLTEFNDPHLVETPLGVKFLRDAAAGKLKRLTPAELEAAKKAYPSLPGRELGRDGG